MRMSESKIPTPSFEERLKNIPGHKEEYRNLMFDIITSNTILASILVFAIGAIAAGIYQR